MQQIDLFANDPGSDSIQIGKNILPEDGDTRYYGALFSPDEADVYFNRLSQEITWKHDEARIFGRHYVTARKVAWYGDSEYDYRYSGASRKALPWTELLLQIKMQTEARLSTSFNSCLLNLYHNGGEGMAWHSDDEKGLGAEPTIASVSFGAERRFCLRRKSTKQKIELVLKHGSLLQMAGETQTYWQHTIPKTTKVQSPRINLTFRNFL